MKLNSEETQEVIEAIESSSLSVSQVIELIAGSQKNEKVADLAAEITLTIDYTKTVEQAIAAGNYGWKNSDINAKNFPISPAMTGKKVEVSTKLFHFNKDISSDNAISEMDKAGYRPATLMELLVLGFLFPELQRKFPIVALGSVWRPDRGPSVCYLCADDFSSRGLDFSWFAGGWVAQCRFLGVRK